MFEFFSNPGYLVAGGALVSVPIIIHLINRMRFRRIRWAAMEFLLKSQKRNRRRLIIEQLILLMLRCMLVLLTAVLVLRFVGLGLGGFSKQAGFHVVILDDTLSMNDRWQENGKEKNCFDVARKLILSDEPRNIYNQLAQSTTNERLVIVPLSKAGSITDEEWETGEFKTIAVFDKLASDETRERVRTYLDRLQPSKMHVDLATGVATATRLFQDHPRKRRVLHILSDFRRADWAGSEAKPLLAKLRELQTERDVKILPVDTAHPYRLRGRGGALQSHHNVGIVDFRPNTRVAGKGTPVTFTIKVANFSPNPKELDILLYDGDTGARRFDLRNNFHPALPLKVPANGTATTQFYITEFNLRDEKRAVVKLLARLVSADQSTLESEEDGLDDDNLRYAGVEVREKVPVLVVDGLGRRGLKDGKDSFFIEKAFQAVPGGSFELVFAHDLNDAKPTAVLERGDLNQYPTIFLLNVRELLGDKVKTGNAEDVPELERQIYNLEQYVKDGGGVVFFLGPLVNAKHYNQKLYRAGKGVFPAPLVDPYFPPPNEKPLEPKYTGDPQLLLRYDQIAKTEDLPIFGSIFRGDKSPPILADLPVFRYFKVDRAAWTKNPGETLEVATLPNSRPASDYVSTVLDLIKRLPIEDPKYKKYRAGLEFYQGHLRRVIEPGASYKAFQLAAVIKLMLEDKGNAKAVPSWEPLEEFWAQPDPKIRLLKRDFEAIYADAQFGDPFVVLRKYGKGRVAAVFTTAGKDWNHFAGGSLASWFYQPFIWELQNWLSSQAADTNRLVGQKVKVLVELATPGQNKKAEPVQYDRLKVVRTFYGTLPEVQGQQAKEGNLGTSFVAVGGKNTVPIVLDGQEKPGFYVTEVFPPLAAPAPLASWTHVFNVDTEHEGQLKRISQDEMRQIAESEGLSLLIDSPLAVEEESLTNRQSDLSESGLLFLIFLVVLISEQALAVHLSFHLRSNEGQAGMPGAAGSARAA